MEAPPIVPHCSFSFLALPLTGSPWPLCLRGPAQPGLSWFLYTPAPLHTAEAMRARSPVCYVSMLRLLAVAHPLDLVMQHTQLVLQLRDHLQRVLPTEMLRTGTFTDKGAPKHFMAIDKATANHS